MSTRRLTPAQQKDIIMRAGKCSACGEDDIRLLQVHHIKPFAEGGSNKPENLSVLCPTCHQKAEKGLINPKPVSETEKLPREDDQRRGETKVDQSHIASSNVVGTARDVHIYQTPQSKEPGEKRTRKVEWDVDAEFSLEPDEFRSFPVELHAGGKLSGLVEAEDHISCYVLGPNSLQSFEDGEDFNSYWDSEDVKRTNVSFTPKSGHKFFFVVRLDEEADESVSVSVKLRTET